MGVIELGRMMGTDPNLALSVLEGLGRWEAGRSAGDMALQREGLVRVQERAVETSTSSSRSSSTTTTTSSGERTPPSPRPPSTNPASRVARKTHVPSATAKQRRHHNTDEP